MLKLRILTHHVDITISVAQSLLSSSSVLDEIIRKNLTDLKVYAIDVDEADEVVYHSFFINSIEILASVAAFILQSVLFY